MKILIYGAGVIGSIFAVKLSNAGQDITVLARGKRFEEIRENGVVICNPKTNRRETAKVHVIDKLTDDMIYDAIFVVMQRTQVEDILEPLAANPSKNIVFVVNTASGYAQWEAAIGKERLMIGFPSAGGERKDGIVYYFIGKGLMRGFQTTTFGEIDGQKTERIKTICDIFRRAGIPSVIHDDIDAWQKTHVAVVTCIANAIYGHGCDAKSLSRSRRDLKEMILGIQEGFSVLKKIGIQPTPRKLSMFALPAGVLATVFGFFMKTQLADVTMVRHCVAAKPEMIFLQNEFDKLIEKSGQKTPNIDALRRKLLSE